MPILILLALLVACVAPVSAELTCIAGDQTHSVLAAPASGDAQGTYLLVPDGEPVVLSGPKDRVHTSGPMFCRQFRMFVIGVEPGAACTLTVSHPGSYAYLNARPWPGDEWMRIISSLCANWDRQALQRPQENLDVPNGARLLIITHDSFNGRFDNYVNWKWAKGFLPRVVTLSETGSDAASIKAYIQNAYTTWTVPPEYILLIGDSDYIPFTGSDNYYAEMTGDMMIDIIIGRMPCRSGASYPDDPENFQSRSVTYEQTPGFPDTMAYHRVTMMLNYPDADHYQYDTCADTVESLMGPHGYTAFRRMPSTSYSRTQVIDTLLAGETFICYRGDAVTDWWPPFQSVLSPYPNNAGKLPMIVSITCGTGSFQNAERYFCEQWLFGGNATNPLGCIGYTGVTDICGSCWQRRNGGTIGYWRALFEQNIPSIGGDSKWGKAYMYANRVAGGAEADGATEYGNEILLGDPTLWQWTAVPKTLTVTHQTAVGTGTVSVPIVVTDAAGAVSGALVCIQRASDVYAYGYTGSNGRDTLTMNIPGVGNLTITVSAPNHRYYQSTITVAPPGAYLQVSAHSYVQSTGDGDAFHDVGEVWETRFTVTNYGMSAAGSGSVDLVATAPGELVAGHATFASIAAGGSRDFTGFTFRVGPNSHNGDTIGLTFTMRAGLESWQSEAADFLAAAPAFQIAGTTISDPTPTGNGNGVLDRGEMDGVRFTYTNVGHGNVSDPRALLSTTDANLRAYPTNSVLTIAGASATQVTPFPVSVHPAHPGGGTAAVSVRISGTLGTYAFAQDLPANLTIGALSATSATGPDAYGYYLIEDVDTFYNEAPSMSNWLEIAPSPGATLPRITNADADTQNVTLPFTSSHYGTTYSILGVCANGFMQAGPATYRFGTVSRIPGATPPNLIAPLWSDLNPSASGDIYGYSDAANHRYIVEFQNVPVYGGAEAQTFQVQVLDPAFTITPTGDAEYLYLYQTFTPFSSYAYEAGIANASGSVGIEYAYENGGAVTLGQNVTGLVSGRAMRITTKPPTLRGRGWLIPDSVWVNDPAPGGNGNHYAELGESFDLYLRIRNVGTVTVQASAATLLNDGQPLTFVRAAANYPVTGGGSTSSFSGSPWRLTVTSGLAGNQVYLMRAQVTAAGYSGTLLFPLQLYTSLEVVGPNGPQVQRGLILRDIRPNPTPGPFEVRFFQSAASAVDVTVTDLTGRVYYERGLGMLPVGEHVAPIAVDLPAGAYWVTLKSADERVTGRFVVVPR